MFQFLTGGRNAIRLAFSPNVVPLLLWMLNASGEVRNYVSNPKLEILGRALDKLFHRGILKQRTFPIYKSSNSNLNSRNRKVTKIMELVCMTQNSYTIKRIRSTFHTQITHFSLLSTVERHVPNTTFFS